GYAFALILIPLGPLAVLAHIGELPLARDILMVGLALFVPVGLLVLWILRLFSPRMVDYDSRSALLVNVARGFAEAVEGRKLPGLPGKLPSGQVLPGQAHTGIGPNWVLIGAVFGGCAVLMLGCVGMMLVAGAIGRAGRAQQLAQTEARFKQMQAGAEARRDQFLAERGGPRPPNWAAPPVGPPSPPPSVSNTAPPPAISAAPPDPLRGFGNPATTPVPATAPPAAFPTSPPGSSETTPPVATGAPTPAETKPAEPAPNPVPTRPRNPGFPPDFPPGFPSFPEGTPGPPDVPGFGGGFGAGNPPAEMPRRNGSRRPSGGFGSDEQREEFRPGRGGQFPPKSKQVAAASQLQPGAQVWVLWGPVWYRSTVVDSAGRQAAKVHYLGWGSNFDQVVPLEGIRLATDAASSPGSEAPEGGNQPAHSRTWTDATGQFKVEAEFVEMQGNIVVLKKTADGQAIRIPLDKLSAEDQKTAKQLK
ncbi:MAG TPA: SHD1 domain-containing protein, partial [Pirellulaceae bacterium]|nr:SHD1 domain-containing protein [Pirellulaceae bacterium]